MDNIGLVNQAGDIVGDGAKLVGDGVKGLVRNTVLKE